MERTLIDTDVLSDYLKCKSGAKNIPRSKAIDFCDKYLNEKGFLSFSVVTYYEIRRGLLKRGMSERLYSFDAICSLSEIIPLDAANRGDKQYPDVWETASEIWAELNRKGKPVSDNDLLIASTAIVNRYVLATRNKRHFEPFTNRLVKLLVFE